MSFAPVRHRVSETVRRRLACREIEIADNSRASATIGTHLLYTMTNHVRMAIAGLAGAGGVGGVVRACRDCDCGADGVASAR